MTHRDTNSKKSPFNLVANAKERNVDMNGHRHRTKLDYETTVAWTELGHGQPLVLLHGLRDSHRTWRRLAPLLAQDYRVIMPDLPGHGWSSRPDAPYTLGWYAQTVSAWMGAIGVERAHICGHSFGGGIAQWMMLGERRRIDRLCLVSPGGLGRSVGMGMKFAAIPVLGAKLTPVVIRYGLPIVLKLSAKTFGYWESGELEHYQAMNRIEGSDTAFRRSLTGVIRLTGQYVQTIQRSYEIESLPPIAMFWGESDPVIPVRHGRRAQRKSKGVTLTTYPQCGHFPQLEEPDRLAEDLREFLSDTSRGCASLFPGQPKLWAPLLSRSAEATYLQ